MKDPTKMKEPAGSLPLALFLFGLLLLVTIVMLVFTTVKQQDIDRTKQEVTDLQKQTISLQTPEVIQLEQSKKIVDQMIQKKMPWVKILQELFISLPPSVSVLSLSGDLNGKLTANLVTTSTTSVTKVLETLKQLSFFQDVFIPSVATSNAGDQGDVIHFPLVLDVKSIQTKQSINTSSPEIKKSSSSNTNTNA